MIFLRKYFFLFLLTTISLPISGITISDSSKSYSRFSVGVGFVSFSLMKYRFPDYKNLDPNCNKCSSKDINTYVTFLFVDDVNVSGSYHFSKRALLKLGIRHLHEEIPGGSYNFDYNGDTTTMNFIGTLRNRYLSLPLSIGLKIPNNKSESWHTVLEAGVNFDFIYREVQSGGYQIIGYSDTSTSTYYHYFNKPFHARDNKYNFNRISPFIHLYFEWYNRKRIFSFSWGSSFTFESAYQLKNTAEYYKYYKICPFTWGLSYHIK